MNRDHDHGDQATISQGREPHRSKYERDHNVLCIYMHKCSCMHAFSHVRKERDIDYTHADRASYKAESSLTNRCIMDGLLVTV